MSEQKNQFINLFDYEHATTGILSDNALGYYAGGSGDEVTLQDNRDAYNRVKLAPRMMVDVSKRDLSCTVLDQTFSAPIITAPMAIMKLAHPDGELALARAAGSRGIPMGLSTMSSTSIEDVTAVANAPMWFQLYVYKDREVTRNLVARAEAAGHTALVLTVDANIPGLRERDVRNRLTLPDGVRLENLVAFSLEKAAYQGRDSALSAYAGATFDASLTWKDLEWLAGITRLPILVKGILRPDDAHFAIDHGAKGVIVSNHGGRQLDTTPATLDVLPRIVDEIGYRGEVLMDGGIRRGTDILKALAYGAKAVMVGRPLLWGLAVDGEAGAGHVLDILIGELSNAMGLAGCASLNDITRDLIFKP